MSETVWLALQTIVAAHDVLLARHGGLPGVRDQGLLDSALSRPQNILAFSEGGRDLCALAASYAYGIARNHSFIDGNKRTAFISMQLFLRLNGHELTVSDGCTTRFYR